MEGDLARDPVFGEVARALGPRAFHALAHEDLGDETTTWVHIAFRRAGLTPERAAAMVGQDGLFYREVERHGQVEGHVHALVAGLRRAAPEHAALAALWAAWEGWSRVPRAPEILGVLNVTPDSFSDGGRFLDPARAVEHGLRLVAEGARILDVGGESTRPGAEPVSTEVEIARVVPVIAALARQCDVPLSIDTSKSAVAEAALDAGATMVNDVSAGLDDPLLIPLVARRGARYVAMHRQGRPIDMQVAPRYGDVVTDVLEFLRERAACCLEAGIARDGLAIDPGIGFGKTPAHNLVLLRRLPELRSLGLPLVLGVSRKSFIAHVHPPARARRERVGGTAAAVAIGVLNGAEILRVHDVAVMSECVAVARAIRDGETEGAR